MKKTLLIGLMILALVITMIVPAAADDPGWNYKFDWGGGVNTYNPDTGWTYGFSNHDRSQNEYHTNDGSWSFGFGDGERETMNYRDGGDGRRLPHRRNGRHLRQGDAFD